MACAQATTSLPIINKGELNTIARMLCPMANKKSVVSSIFL